MSETIDHSPQQPEHMLPTDHPSAMGRLALHDGHLAESVRDDAEQIFQSGNLLVRGLDAPVVRPNPSGGLGLEYEIIDRETDDLFGAGDEHGLWYASSTLILPGKRIPTYKNFGFMFNGATAELHHIHHQDSGSNGQGEDFMAAQSDLSSLAELAAGVTNENPQMNEVNATFKDSDLVGIFALEARKPVAKVSAWFMQQRLRVTTGKELPIYVYNIEAGEIAQWQPTNEEMQSILDAAFRQGKIKDVYVQELAALSEQ